MNVKDISESASQKAMKDAVWKARRLAMQVRAPKHVCAAMPCTSGRKFIVDRGPCFDIVNAYEMEPGEAKQVTKSARPYRMITAAGVVKAERETTVRWPTLGRRPRRSS